MAEILRSSYEKPLEGLSLKEQVALLKNELSETKIRLQTSEEKFRLMNESSQQRISELNWTIRFFEDMISQILFITPEWEEKARIIAEIEEKISNDVRDRVDEIVLW